MVWDAENQRYDYALQAYYNPKDDNIIIEDVSSKGGQIYLTGRISSTGCGNLFVADGAADINVTNAIDKALATKILDTGNREGIISITDLAKTKDDKGNDILGTLTEITSKGANVFYLRKGSDNDKNYKATTPDAIYSSMDSYIPLENMTYHWSSGKYKQVRYHWEKEEDSIFWGLASWDNYSKKI